MADSDREMTVTAPTRPDGDRDTLRHQWQRLADCIDTCLRCGLLRRIVGRRESFEWNSTELVIRTWPSGKPPMPTCVAVQRMNQADRSPVCLDCGHPLTEADHRAPVCQYCGVA